MVDPVQNERDLSSWKAPAVALLAVTTILLLLCWLSAPRWQTNDDISMSMVAHGYGVAASGAPPYLMFSNVLWGFFVRALPTLNGVPGYSLATLATLLVAGSSIGYALLRLRVSFAVCAPVLVLVFARPILFPQFTVNAGLLMVATIMVLRVYAVDGRVVALVAACLLSFASYLIRSQEFLFVCAVGWPFLPIRQFVRDRRAVLGVGVVASAIAASAFVDYQAYKAPEWRDFNALNHVRALLTDFGAAEPLKERPDVLAKHGFSQNDLALVRYWFFVDPNLANPPVLEAMLSEAGAHANAERNLANVVAGLGSLGHRSLWMLALAALGISAMGVRRPILVAWTIFVAAIALLGYLGRPGILHVYIPLLALLTIAPLAGMRWRRPFSVFLAVILGAAAALQVLDVVAESRSFKVADAQVRELVSGIDDRSVVVWGESFPFEAVYPVLGSSAAAMKYKLYGLGVSTLAPFAIARSESLAGRGMIERLRSPEGVPIFANSTLMKMLEVYCYEHFDGQFQTMTVPPAGTIAPSWYRCSANRPRS
jgi:hypothetical protein